MENLEATDDTISSSAFIRSPLTHVRELNARNESFPSELCLSKRETAKHRGRPRSLVFNYFRRIEDDNGGFEGNQCCFCPFISRDKSENSTYLRRHIQRACKAPEYVKEAMAWRKFSSEPFLPHNASPLLGKESKGKHCTAELTYKQDRICLRKLSAASPWKTYPCPEVTPSNPPVAHVIRKTVEPSQSLWGKSTGKKVTLLNPRRTGVGKNRCTTQPLLKLKRLCEKSVDTADLEKSLTIAERSRDKAKVLFQRARVPVEVKQKCLDGLATSAFYDHPNPRISIGQAMTELLSPLEYDKRSANSKQDGKISQTVQFLLAHHVCLEAVENPTFRRIPFQSFKRTRMVNADSARLNFDVHRKTPSKEDVLECLTNTSRSDIVNDFNAYRDPFSSNAKGHLVICFSDTENRTFSNRGIRSSYSERDAHVASYFRLIHNSPLHPAQLFYIGSRNCGMNPSFSSLSDIIGEAESQVLSEFSFILLSRSVGSELFWSSRPQRFSSEWTLDIRREADVLCQELLSKAPFLKRVHRQNRIIASFFREQAGNRSGSCLFGSSRQEREAFEEYISFISGSHNSHPTCHSGHVVQSAVHTHSLLHVAQAGQSCKDRVRDIHKFLTSLSEENCGSVAICQEIVRLVLSPTYLRDLKHFIAILNPLANLISLYSDGDSARRPLSSTISSGHNLRSIGYVLHDCSAAFNEMFTNVNQNNLELQQLKEFVFARLFRFGPSGLPPIVSEICYLASILNPAIDVDTSTISKRDILSRAVNIARSKFTHAGIDLERDLLEFQENKSVRKRESINEMSRKTMSKYTAVWDNEYVDPLMWWIEYGEKVPYLHHIALRVLDVPSTAPSVIRFITNNNADCDDLRGHSRDCLSEKRRFTSWNLKLCDSNLQLQN